jgi:molybdopterin/thiamine biosynthesis adenylyltransferase
MQVFDSDQDEDRYRGQRDVVDIERLQAPITIIGAGAIGSLVTMSLAKMGCGDITVYDDDTIEMHNLSNQFYREEDLERPKVEALKRIITSFCGIDITPVNKRFEGEDLETYVLVSAVDSMQVRHDLFKFLRETPLKPKLFVDGRMGALFGHTFFIDTENEERMQQYQEEFLFPPEEAEPLPCTEKSTMFTALGIAAQMSGVITSFMGREGYKLPFERALDFAGMTINPVIPEVTEEAA